MAYRDVTDKTDALRIAQKKPRYKKRGLKGKPLQRVTAIYAVSRILPRILEIGPVRE